MLSAAYLRWQFWTLRGTLLQRWLKNLSFFLPAFLVVFTVTRWQAILHHKLSWPDFLSLPVIFALLLSVRFARRNRLTDTVSE